MSVILVRTTADTSRFPELPRHYEAKVLVIVQAPDGLKESNGEQHQTFTERNLLHRSAQPDGFVVFLSSERQESEVIYLSTE